MECIHAYKDREIDYILCDKEKKPYKNDRSAVFHAMCSHQALCPKANCHKLTASWLDCAKLKESAQNGAEETFDEADDEPTEAQKAPRKKRRVAQKEE